jgi:hypothetical protein
MGTAVFSACFSCFPASLSRVPHLAEDEDGHQGRSRGNGHADEAAALVQEHHLHRTPGELARSLPRLLTSHSACVITEDPMSRTNKNDVNIHIRVAPECSGQVQRVE